MLDWNLALLPDLHLFAFILYLPSDQRKISGRISILQFVLHDLNTKQLKATIPGNDANWSVQGGTDGSDQRKIDAFWNDDRFWRQLLNGNKIPRTGAAITWT
jgi:hypothetical protein